MAYITGIYISEEDRIQMKKEDYASGLFRRHELAEDTDYVRLHAALLAARQRQRVSLGRLARAIRCTAKSVSDYESMRSVPEAETLKRWAAYLRVPIPSGLSWLIPPGADGKP